MILWSIFYYALILFVVGITLYSLWELLNSELFNTKSSSNNVQANGEYEPKIVGVINPPRAGPLLFEDDKTVYIYE